MDWIYDTIGRALEEAGKAMAPETRLTGVKGFRTIKYIVVHCSATAEGRDFGAADIDRWHKAKGCG